MLIQPRDAAYPELKKSHTMAHTGRPFTDYKPPPAAPVWAVIEGLGRYHVLLAALELGVFESLAELEREPPTTEQAKPKHKPPTGKQAKPEPKTPTGKPTKREPPTGEQAKPKPEPRTGATKPEQTYGSRLTSGVVSGATANDLAKRLHVSRHHLEALLDSLVALGFIDRTQRDPTNCDPSNTTTSDSTANDTVPRNHAPTDCSLAIASQADHQTSNSRSDHNEGVYELNDTARRYLLDDGPASMTGLVPVAPGPHANWTKLADTVSSGRPATPIDDHPADFYRPLVEGTFTTMLRCATRADLHVRYSALAAPRVLDLGAGGAPWSIAVLKACGQGRAVINDLPEVIGVAEGKTSEHGVADRCEFRPGDFHTVYLEPEHYDIVFLGHVCRTEGPVGARRLVARAFGALKPEGRLLLADYFVPPDRKSSPHATLMGMTMMASTVNGFPVTTESACEWLQDAGFEAIRLIEPIGFQFAYVATKPPTP